MKVFQNDKCSIQKLSSSGNKAGISLNDSVLFDLVQFPMRKLYCDIYSKMLKGRVASF